MKKKILSTLLSLAVFASTAVTSLAATQPSYNTVSGNGVDSIGKDVSMDGGIYGLGWVPEDDELSIISLRIPSRFVFAVYSPSQQINDTAFVTVDEYYIENLGAKDVRVSLTGTSFKDSTGSTVDGAKIKLLPEKQAPSGPDELSLSLDFKGTDGAIVNAQLTEGRENTSLGVIGSKSSNNNKAYLKLQGQPFTELPGEQKIKNNFSVGFMFEAIK